MDALQVVGTLSAPDLSQLTTSSLTGTGAFDKLMAATKLHLQEEFDADRISKDEYSSVYLGAMQAVLAQSVQFLLNHATTEKIVAEIGLLRQKTATELAQTDDTLQDGLGFNGDTTIQGLVALQMAHLTQQTLTETEQTGNLAWTKVLTGQKIITELAQTDDDISSASAYGVNNSYAAGVEGMVAAQINQSVAEKELTQQKTMTELAATSDALPTDYGQGTNATLEGLMKIQKDKGLAEIQLLDQKSVSELAQTHDTVPAASGSLQTASYSVSGVIGKQKLLFTAQTDGFARDAEQKLSKIMVDSLIAGIAADNGTVVTGTNLDNTNIGLVISNAMQGIGSTPAGTTSGVLTFTGQPANTETVTIGLKTYTFQTALTDVDGNVAIGATLTISIDNLIAAIEGGAGSGTAYAASTTAHPSAAIIAVAHLLDTMTLAVTGSTLNTTETIALASWGSGTTV
jgi:hypothetical protein